MSEIKQVRKLHSRIYAALCVREAGVTHELSGELCAPYAASSDRHVMDLATSVIFVALARVIETLPPKKLAEMTADIESRVKRYGGRTKQRGDRSRSY